MIKQVVGVSKYKSEMRPALNARIDNGNDDPSMSGKTIPPAEKFHALCINILQNALKKTNFYRLVSYKYYATNPIGWGRRPLCGKGCTVFHTSRVTPVNFDVMCVNSDETPVNFDVTCVNSDATPVNFDVTCVNSVVMPVNFDVTCINSVATPVNSDVTCINSDATCIHFDVTSINLDVMGKNLCARRINLWGNFINPRAVRIYRDAVYGKPNAPILLCLKIFWTNKAAAYSYSHVSTEDLNKAVIVVVKAPVNPYKRVNARQK